MRKASRIRSTASPESQPNFDDSFHHRPGIGHAQPQHQPGMGSVALDFAQLLDVVVRDERLVPVQGFQRFLGLDRVGVDDLVPDERLPLPAGKCLMFSWTRRNSGRDATSKLAPAR